MAGLVLSAPSVQAEATTVEDLQRRLQQRDQVILELIERVEMLELETGVQPARTKAVPSDRDRNAQGTATVADAAPGAVRVDASLAERALERSLTQDGALLLAPGVFEIEPRLSYGRQEDATPSFVMSGGGVVASKTERNSDSLSASLSLRLGLGWDSQLELAVPYRWRHVETATSVGFTPVQASSESGAGVGDVRLTLAKTLLHETSGWPDVIGRLSWDSDSGETDDDGVALGGGYNEAQGGLSFISRQDPMVFISGLSYQYTYEKERVRPGGITAASFGSYIALNPRTSLNLQLSLARQGKTRLDGSPLAGTDRVLGSLVIGGASLVGRGTLLNLSLGVGLTDDADDFTVSLSLPMRF